MKNRILALLALTLMILGSGLMSCDEEFDCGPFHANFKITGLSSEIYQINYSPTDRLTLEEIEDDGIPYDKFSIGILQNIETYGWQDKNWNLGLISTANACSPLIPQSEEKIDSINIIANKDFNSEYLRDTDLSELFDIIVYYEFNNIFEKFDLNEFILTEPVAPNEAYLVLKEKPGSTTDFQFTVKYYQQGIDFDFFEFTTRSVFVLEE